MKRIISTAMFACLLLAWFPVAADFANPSEIPAELFAQLPVMSDAELSPDGQYIAYFQPHNGRIHVVIQSLNDKAERVILPPFENMDFLWINWANNDRLVFAMYFFADRWGTESNETRLASIDKKATDLTLLVKPLNTAKFRNMTPRQQHRVINWLPDDPDHILLSVDEDFDGDSEVRKVNVATGTHKTILAGPEGIQIWITDTAGDIRLGYGVKDHNYRARVKNAKGKWVSIKADWLQDYKPIAFTEDPDLVYVTGPGENGLTVLRTLRLSDGALLGTVFSAAPYDIRSLLLDPVDRKPVGVRFIDDDTQTVYFDPVFAQLQRTLDSALGQSRNMIVDSSDDRMRLLVNSTTGSNPGVYYYWDRESKLMSAISTTMPGLPNELLADTTSIEYKARDGTTIPGYLTLPKDKDDSKLPAIILPHGGPNSRSTSQFWFLTQFFASRGYAVLQPNFRGSSGYGTEFEYAGDSQWGGLMQDDVTDGARWLIDQGIADADRLCIVGWSYGGYAAAMGAVKTPDLYRCAVSINGVLNLPRLVDSEKRFVGWRIWSKSIGLEGEALWEVSPFHQAEKIKIPMLIIHASDDGVVPEKQAESMAGRLRRLKNPVELVTVELGGHAMNNADARLTILTSIEQFLESNIGISR